MILHRSAYTLAEPWTDGRGILINTLSGASHVVDARLVALARDAAQLADDDPRLAALADVEPEAAALLADNGYYVESTEAEAMVARALARRRRTEAPAEAEPKYVLALTMACNLACAYCWQAIDLGPARNEGPAINEERLDAALSFIAADMARRGKASGTLSLFGGEPFISPASASLLDAIAARAPAGLRLHAATNGKLLHHFAPRLTELNVSIQVTIDGLEDGPGGEPVATRAGQPLPRLLPTLRALSRDLDAGCFLRFLVTPATLPHFLRLAELVHGDGWGPHLRLGVAPVQAKAAGARAAASKTDMLARVVTAMAGRAYRHHVDYMDWRGLSLLRHLRMGEDRLPYPSFSHCEANNGLLGLGPDGLVHACYEGIGEEAFAIGRYWPDPAIDGRRHAEYLERSAFTVKGCEACAAAPLCGGGCQVRGRKRNGAFDAPHCDEALDQMAYVLRNWSSVMDMLTGAP
ncbi:MAG: SPASM domain-containing protein [Pseudomonadota bacterium]